MSEERYRRLREENNQAFYKLEDSIASNVRGLEVLRTRISRNISEIVLIRDGVNNYAVWNCVVNVLM